MKDEAVNSPRTSAGISKSLLTPCRRLGLVRRRTTASPLTPQGVSSTPSDTPSAIAKRTPETPRVTSIPKQDSDASTPIRTLGQPRRQKSKKLITSLADDPSSPHKSVDCIEGTAVKVAAENEDTEIENISIVTEKRDINSSLNKSKQTAGHDAKDTLNKIEETDNDIVLPTRKKSSEKTQKRLSKRKSGDLNLTRKCIVVIDDHILKSANQNSPTNIDSKENDVESVKNLINYAKVETCNENGSDVDDVPLSEISKNNKNIKEDTSTTRKRPHIITLDEDDSDFYKKSFNRPEKVKSNPKVAKLEKTKNAGSSSSNELSDKLKVEIHKNPQLSNKLTQSESDDDDFECRKTVIRKSNPKTVHKAKSTGSITQKDIDDIKVRIQMKKNALLAKSGAHNVEELTELIKKWRRGCQEALMELLEIMKRKVPEKRNMKTVELLKMLNIPIELVDYNVEDECFVSPN